MRSSSYGQTFSPMRWILLFRKPIRILQAYRLIPFASLPFLLCLISVFNEIYGLTPNWKLQINTIQSKRTKQQNNNTNN